MKLTTRAFGFQLLGTAFLAIGTALPAWADYESTLLSQGPVGYWRLNETTQPQPLPFATNLGSLGAVGNGSYVLDPIRGQSGALVGSPDTSVGFSNPGFVVGYCGTKIDVPNAPALNPSGSFSVECWVRPNAAVPDVFCVMSSMDPGDPATAPWRSGWLLYQTAANKWQFRLGSTTGYTDGGAVVGGSVTPGAWHHVVAVYDSGTANAYLYVNGVLAVGPKPISSYTPNGGRTFRLGGSPFNGEFGPTAGNRGFDGSLDEIAFYGVVLSADTIKSHYDAASTNGIGYATQVLADLPVGYWRLGEAREPTAVNLGTLGNAKDGLYIYNSKPGTTGPQPPPLAGFATDNKGVSFDGAGAGAVRIPPLDLNTNTVTITTWINAKGAQALGAGLVFCRAGSTVAGLNIDAVYGGLGLGYTWNNDANSSSWSPSTESGLPTLPDSQWAFAALVVRPDQAVIYIGDPTKQNGFAAATNLNLVAHAVQDFEGDTLFGADPGFTPARSLNGVLDEVAIFNRSLSKGEIFSQFATGVGGIAPEIFADLEASPDTVVGNPLVLSVDAGGTQPLTYTWHRTGVEVATTTSGVLTIASASAGDSGTYEVTVTNSSGAVTSSQVVVVVEESTAPSITQLQGFQDRTLYPGGTLSLGVVATGGGLHYQWEKNGAPLAGATTDTYLVANVTATNGGAYKVVVSNSVSTATSATVNIVVASPAPGSYPAVVVADAPEAWYRLNEPVGSSVMYDAMARHDGQYVNNSGNPVTLGVPGITSGDPDTAASFDGSDSYGSVPYSPDLNNADITIEVWAKTTVLDDISLCPVSSRFSTRGYWFYTYPSGSWSGGVSSEGSNYYVPSTNAEAAIFTDQWTHLVMTVSSGSMRYYVNGTWDNESYVDFDLNVAGPLLIGARGVDASTAADMFFKGQVDEVAVYKHALTATQVKAHYEARFGSTTAPYFIGAFLPQTVTTGRSLSYTTSVQGSIPITLQWYKGASPINGATNASFEIANTALSDTGTYTLWATNAAGVNSQSVAVTVISPVNYANVTNNLALHLRFDGDTADSSGRSNNGTPVGSPTFVTGLIGPQALQYITETETIGTVTTVTNASYVDLSVPADLQFGSATSFTIGLWVKLPTNFDGGDLPFIGNAINSMNNPGWVLGPTYGGGGWQWCLGDGVSPGLTVTNTIDVNGAAGSINDGAWHNFVLTVDRTAKVANSYLDGLLMASRDITSLGSVDTGAAFTIGQDPTGLYPETGTATLDDIGIWRQALTPLDVAQIYSAGTTSGRSFDTVGTANVTITLTTSGSSVTLSWPTGTLQQSDTLGASASWTAVPGASAPSYTFTPGTGNKFYRVQL